jgi:hypothetical protein
MQLKNSSKEFFDKNAELMIGENKELGTYRLVFIKTNNIDEVPINIKGITRVYFLCDGWFYYRTHNLNYIDKF